MSGSEYRPSKFPKGFLIAGVVVTVIGVGMLFSGNLNKEWREAPKYRNETIDLALDQFFGKEAVSLGVVNAYDVPVKEKKGAIAYYLGFENEVIFHKEFRDDTSIEDNVTIFRSMERKISVKLPAQKFYSVKEVQWKDNQLMITSRKNRPLYFWGLLVTVEGAVVAMLSLLFSIHPRRREEAQATN